MSYKFLWYLRSLWLNYTLSHHVRWLCLMSWALPEWNLCNVACWCVVSNSHTGDIFLFICDASCNTLCGVVGKYYAGKMCFFFFFNAIAGSTVVESQKPSKSLAFDYAKFSLKLLFRGKTFQLLSSSLIHWPEWDPIWAIRVQFEFSPQSFIDIWEKIGGSLQILYSLCIYPFSLGNRAICWEKKKHKKDLRFIPQ